VIIRIPWSVFLFNGDFLTSPGEEYGSACDFLGKQPIKFRTDVAMMCKLGFDIRVNEMSEAEQTFCSNAVKNFKRLENVILDGDMYRLVSPYEKDHAAMAYVNENKDHAVLFAFDIHPRYAELTQPVKLQGLDPQANYKVEEINLMPDAPSRLRGNGKIYSGEFLMTVGLPILSSRSITSHILEITRR
jgi:alpha-galactosidase